MWKSLQCREKKHEQSQIHSSTIKIIGLQMILTISTRVYQIPLNTDTHMSLKKIREKTVYEKKSQRLISNKHGV